MKKMGDRDRKSLDSLKHSVSRNMDDDDSASEEPEEMKRS